MLAGGVDMPLCGLVRSFDSLGFQGEHEVRKVFVPLEIAKLVIGNECRAYSVREGI